MSKVRKAFLCAFTGFIVLCVISLAYVSGSVQQWKGSFQEENIKMLNDIPAETLRPGLQRESLLSGVSSNKTEQEKSDRYCSQRIMVRDGQLYYLVQRDLIACPVTLLYRFDERRESGMLLSTLLQDCMWKGFWDNDAVIQVTDYGIFSPKIVIYGFFYRTLDQEKRIRDLLPRELISFFQEQDATRLYAYPLGDGLVVVVKDKLYLVERERAGDCKVTAIYRKIKDKKHVFQDALMINSDGQWYLLCSSGGQLLAYELPDYVAVGNADVRFCAAEKRLYYHGKMENSNGIHVYDLNHPEDSWLLLIDDPAFHYIRYIADDDNEQYVYYIAGTNYNMFDYQHAVLRRYNKASKAVDTTFTIPIELEKGVVDSAVVFHDCLYYTTEGGKDDKKLYRKIFE